MRQGPCQGQKTQKAGLFDKARPKYNLFLGNQLFLAAHVGTQHLGDGDGAIGLQVVFQEGNEHTGRSHTGVVEGVGQIALAIGALYPDAQAAGLSVAQVGAAAHLKVFLLAGAPGLDIAALYLQVGQVAGAAFQLTDRDLQVAEELHAVLPELLVPGHAVFRAPFSFRKQGL